MPEMQHTQGAGPLPSDDGVAVVRQVAEGVVAMAARGGVATELRASMVEFGPLSFQSDGDAATAERGKDHIVVRVQGTACALVVREDGRGSWIESGMRRFRTKEVKHLALMCGFESGPGLRDRLLDWLHAGTDHEQLPEVWGAEFDSVTTVIGVDRQLRDLSEELGPMDADELFEFLEHDTASDERATPEMVRRLKPRALPEEAQTVLLAPGVLQAAPVSTTSSTGPPFEPVMFVRRWERRREEACPDAPTPLAEKRQELPEELVEAVVSEPEVVAPDRSESIDTLAPERAFGGVKHAAESGSGEVHAAAGGMTVPWMVAGAVVLMGLGLGSVGALLALLFI